MQFNRETTNALTIRSCEPGRIRIGETWYRQNLIVAPDRIIEPWAAHHPAQVTPQALQPAIELEPEILLIGTGAAYVMCDVELIGALARQGIGAEVMDTAAACRTFNVLVHESRAVVAALFND